MLRFFYSNVINVENKKGAFVAHFHKAFRSRSLSPSGYASNFAPNERPHKVT